MKKRAKYFLYMGKRNSLVLFFIFQDGFAPPEELEGDGLAQDDEY